MSGRLVGHAVAGSNSCATRTSSADFDWCHSRRTLNTGRRPATGGVPTCAMTTAGCWRQMRLILLRNIAQQMVSQDALSDSWKRHSVLIVSASCLAQLRAGAAVARHRSMPWRREPARSGEVSLLVAARTIFQSAKPCNTVCLQTASHGAQGAHLELSVQLLLARPPARLAQ